MGLTILDAGVLIGFLDKDDFHHDAAVRELEKARHRGDKIVIPASALAESMVAPARKGEATLETFREFVERFPLGGGRIIADAAIIAAQIRALHGPRLKLPDALVIATAIHEEAEFLVTTDRGWPSNDALGFYGEVVTI